MLSYNTISQIHIKLLKENKMADAYGVFIFPKSSDCNMNAAKLVEELNAYK